MDELTHEEQMEVAEKVMGYVADGMNKDEARAKAIEEITGKAESTPSEDKFACKECGDEISSYQNSYTDAHISKPLCKECYAKFLKATGYDPVKPGLVPDDFKVEETIDEGEPDIPEAPMPAPIQKTTISHSIKGITPQLCECGKIKIGMKGAVTESKRGNSFRPPKKLDHFIVTTTRKTKDDDFEIDEEIMSILGDNCTEIPVMLLYDSPELNFLTSYAYYDSAKCQCRGDGEIAETSDGKIKECDPDTCTYATQGKCKPNGILSVMLQDAPRVGGIWKFRTTGWNSIRNLMSSIKFIHDLTGGRLAGLNLVLTLHEKTTLIPGTKNTTKVQMVNLEYKGNLKQLLGEARDRYTSEEKMAQLEAQATEMLALPESAEECKDVQEEFYPETVVV